jgi:iron transport multicopper oxidase
MLTIAALIDNTQGKSIKVKAGTTVRIHIVNIGAFGYFHFWIEEHKLIVIEVDGVDVEPYETDGLDMAVGQRYSILVTMNADKKRNYPIVGALGNSFCKHAKNRPRNV